VFQERRLAVPWIRVRNPLPFLGPAFVTAIAYVDPGNFATNLSAGASYGYLLVWVVVAANIMAMLVQYLSAKVGIATGSSLPALCRDQLPRSWRTALWAQAEAVAVATDLAEVVGGAIALRMLFGLPLVEGGVITGIAAFGMLALRSRGYRPFESAIAALLTVIAAGFVYSLFRGAPTAPGPVLGGLAPRFEGSGSITLAAAMLGATVMPHAIYLHSGLTNDRYAARTRTQRRSLLRIQRLDVISAMSIAGLMNLALLLIAAASLFGSGVGSDIDAAHALIAHVNGRTSATVFAIALLASGLAASSVGTLAGQVVMEGFLQRHLPLVLRRLASMAPALLVLAICSNPTQALVLSQVVLSFGIPFALLPLIAFTRRGDLMGDLVNSKTTTITAGLVAGIIVSLNLCLLANGLLGLLA
jgi:manganese transport protein